MSLGFANIDYAIKTRLEYNMSPDNIIVFNQIVKNSKISGKYEKFALLQILSFNGYLVDNLLSCSRTEKAFKKLLDKNIIKVEKDKYLIK